MARKPATIKDIAIELNISPSTVSRALKDFPGISPVTKKKIVRLAQKLDYQPNALASGLRKSKSDTIGIIVPRISNHFYSSAISGIEEAAYESGYRVIICQSNETLEREEISVKTLIASRVDGLLIAVSRETKKKHHFIEARRRGLPIVFFNRCPANFRAGKVVSDDYSGAYKATEYFIRSGCRRIAHLGGPEMLMLTQNRLNGYKDALYANNIGFNEKQIVLAGTEYLDGNEGMQKLLAAYPHPDAILAFNDRVAIGAMTVIKSRGLKTPDDISVIGFSNTPGAIYVEPSLSTIEQSGLEIGQSAFQLLLKYIGNNTTGNTDEVLSFETKLILRNSTKTL